jgi:hypothetical protein
MTKLKEKLSEIDFSFDENHWKELEKRLDRKRKKRVLFYITTLGILTFIAFGIHSYLSSSKEDKTALYQISAKPNDQSASTNDTATTNTKQSHPGDMKDAPIMTYQESGSTSPYTHSKSAAPSRSSNSSYHMKQLKEDTKQVKKDNKNIVQAPGPKDMQMDTFHTSPSNISLNSSSSIVDHPIDDELARMGMMGLRRIKVHNTPQDTFIKSISCISSVKMGRRYRNELIAGRGFISTPKAPNLESFHALAYHLAYNRYLNKHVFIGLGLAMESYQYSVPDYKIIYHDAVVRDQFMAYNGVRLRYTQLASALSIGYRFNISPKIHMVFEGGIQCLLLVSSRKEIEVSYTVEYKYADTFSRRADVNRVKNDHQEQKNLGLNPLPNYQFTYFGKTGLGMDIWKNRLGCRAMLEYRHLPVLAFVSKPKNHLLVPSVSLYFKF